MTMLVQLETSSPPTLPVERLRDTLLGRLRGLERCMVAYSGGVDSAVVLKAAYLALGKRAQAVTAVSPSLAARERELAASLAQRIGAPHEELQTQEFGNEAYLRNATDRCYHCKSELYSQMAKLAASRGVAYLVNGTNRDDHGDHRPGLQAGREFSVVSPLAELGIGKADVRRLAELWRLPVWDKPASPCLSSRIVYGLQVTPERIGRVEQAETFLLDRGFPVVRVRHEQHDTARVEVPVDRLPELVASPLREILVERLRELGFQRVMFDAEGFRSGNLNAT